MSNQYFFKASDLNNHPDTRIAVCAPIGSLWDAGWDDSIPVAPAVTTIRPPETILSNSTFTVGDSGTMTWHTWADTTGDVTYTNGTGGVTVYADSNVTTYTNGITVFGSDHSTTTNAITYQYADGNWTIGNFPKLSLKDLVKEAIRSNLHIRTGRAKPLKSNVSPQELKARDTLRDLLTEAEWRRYVTNQFLMVKGRKGYWYQIFASQERVRVYKDGKFVNQICIHTDKACPPTDHVINLKILVEFDEDSLWRDGNVSEGYTPQVFTPHAPQRLIEVANRLRA